MGTYSSKAVDQVNLPAGIHVLKWKEFEERYGFNYRRKQQLMGLERALNEFRAAGCTTFYIDGSFVTSKKNPGDYDALYDLDELDEDKINQVLGDSSRVGRERQKQYYAGEFFPVNVFADRYRTPFLDYFQKDKRSGKPKGIIKLELE